MWPDPRSKQGAGRGSVSAYVPAGGRALVPRHCLFGRAATSDCKPCSCGAPFNRLPASCVVGSVQLPAAAGRLVAQCGGTLVVCWRLCFGSRHVNEHVDGAVATVLVFACQSASQPLSQPVSLSVQQAACCVCRGNVDLTLEVDTYLRCVLSHVSDMWRMWRIWRLERPFGQFKPPNACLPVAGCTSQPLACNVYSTQAHSGPAQCACKELPGYNPT